MNKLFTLLLSLSVSALSLTAQDVITVDDEQTGQQASIELPEGMTLPEDELLNQWRAKHYLYADTTCANPDYNPQYTSDTYKERLRRLPVVMEMPYNAIVQKFIDQYTGRLRNSVSYMLGAGNFYIPIFEEALDYYGLPLELKYLPVIESALNPKATSRVGAAGLWQFMLATGKRYNLKVNSLVDERRDPYKATWAAARYLKDLFAIYNDWNLVIAAYNCGPGNVNKAIHRAGGNRDYWTIYPYLPAETRGYVPAFIAANYVMNYYCEHNICPLKTKYPIVTDTVMVDRDVNMKAIAELTNLDLEVVRALNPQYRTDIIPGTSELSSLCLPQEQLALFIDLGDTIYSHRAEELLTRRSEVEVAEKATAASRFKSDDAEDDDAEAVTPRRSRTRQSRTTVVKEKTTKSKTSKKSKETKKSKKKAASDATVKRGDTLEEIAKRNGTTVAKLRKANKIKGSIIKPGQKLKLK